MLVTVVHDICLSNIANRVIQKNLFIQILIGYMNKSLKYALKKIIDIIRE